MNREECKKLLPVMQAFAEGKVIQCRRPDEPNTPWLRVDEPGWLEELEYRVKPEPMVLWVNLYPSGAGSCYRDKDLAESYINHGGRTLRFVEQPE